MASGNLCVIGLVGKYIVPSSNTRTVWRILISAHKLQRVFSDGLVPGETEHHTLRTDSVFLNFWNIFRTNWDKT